MESRELWDLQGPQEKEVFLECRGFLGPKDTEVIQALMELRENLVALERRVNLVHLDLMVHQALWDLLGQGVKEVEMAPLDLQA
jgi:hypothetical protein